MDQVAALIERNFCSANGELRVGGVALSLLANKYGTPFFVYDRHVLDGAYELLRGSLPPEFAICYSVKANPNRKIIKHFLAKGCGLEIASAGEFHQALSAGCAAEKIVFAGPGKTEAELEFVLARGIGEIHAESALEIERIGAISRRLGVCANVALRVNPGEGAQGGAMRMGGKAAPFGVDEECLDPVLDRLLAHPSINFRGIHLFTGTQILDADVILRQYRAGLEIAGRLAGRLGAPLRTVDFGGGLGIPYFSHEMALDMNRLREGLAVLMTEISGENFAGTRFLVEPGRYLVGEAGVYVTRILDIKVSREKKFLIVDGGMNHHLAASGNLGQAIKRNYPVAIVTKLENKPEEVVDVVGPLCTPLDVLGRALTLPKAEVGDLIGIFQSGAYARAASPLGFLSHPEPPEIWVDGGRDSLIRRRGEYGDYLRGQCCDAVE